jgi:hypothetical protein
MKVTATRFVPILFLTTLLAACGSQQADSAFESIAPGRMLAMQSALAVVRADLNPDLHPNPMEDTAYYAEIEPDVQALHRAAREVADIQKDVKKTAGTSSPKYASMDDTLSAIITLSSELVNNFEHPRETAKPAFQIVQKNLNSLSDKLDIALTMYSAIGGPGLPTPETTAVSAPTSTANP